MWHAFLDFYKTNSAFASTVLGAILAIGAFFWRERYNRKRIIRKILCHLLNLYWCQSRLLGFEKTIRKHITPFIQELLKEFSPDTSGDEIAALLVEIEPAISQLSGLAGSHFNYPTESFLKDLEDLSNDYPILAYQLRGIEDIAQTHQALFAYLRSSLVDLTPDAPEALLNNTPLLSEDPLTTLESRIRTTAWKAGIFIWPRVYYKTLPKAKAALSESKSEKEQLETLKNNIRELIRNKIQAAIEEGDTATPTHVDTERNVENSSVAQANAHPE